MNPAIYKGYNTWWSSRVYLSNEKHLGEKKSINATIYRIKKENYSNLKRYNKSTG